MKHLFPLALLLLVWACSSTKDKQTANDTSPWIDRQIDAYKAEEPITPPRTISAYLFDGDTVYHITAPCCDQFSSLYSNEGAFICHPDGGITGKGDGSCPSFRTQATFLFEVWKDERNQLK